MPSESDSDTQTIALEDAIFIALSGINDKMVEHGLPLRMRFRMFFSFALSLLQSDMGMPKTNVDAMQNFVEKRVQKYIEYVNHGQTNLH